MSYKKLPVTSGGGSTVVEESPSNYILFDDYHQDEYQTGVDSKVLKEGSSSFAFAERKSADFNLSMSLNTNGYRSLSVTSTGDYFKCGISGNPLNVALTPVVFNEAFYPSGRTKSTVKYTFKQKVFIPVIDDKVSYFCGLMACDEVGQVADIDKFVMDFCYGLQVGGPSTGSPNDTKSYFRKLINGTESFTELFNNSLPGGNFVELKIVMYFTSLGPPSPPGSFGYSLEFYLDDTLIDESTGEGISLSVTSPICLGYSIVGNDSIDDTKAISIDYDYLKREEV